MSIAEIVAEIESEGKKLALEIEEEYKSKARILQEELDKKYSDEKELELKIVQKEIEETYRGKLLTAKIEKQKEVLKAKKDIIDTLLMDVVNSLKTLAGKEKYGAFLEAIVTKYATSGDVIVLSASDMEYKDTLLKKGEDLTIKEGTLKSGVIIEKKEFNYNFSGETLLLENYLEIENLIGQQINVLR